LKTDRRAPLQAIGEQAQIAIASAPILDENPTAANDPSTHLPDDRSPAFEQTLQFSPLAWFGLEFDDHFNCLFIFC
jgi:hypothetical protein